MTKRERILESAATLFGAHGYRGTTTRLIAAEAGVSEVTLFRIFGTKDELLREALEGISTPNEVVRPLPHTPADPERELVEWCSAYLRQLRASRSIIRKSMGELAQRPSLVPHAAALPADASRVLREYLDRASRDRVLPRGFDVEAAATLLAGVLFADALSRDLIASELPRPENQAPRRYVRLVLDGIYGSSSRRGQRGHAGRRSERETKLKTGFDRRRTGHAGIGAVSRRHSTAEVSPRDRARP